MQDSFLWRRIALVVQADEVVRPAKPQYKPLDPPIKRSNNFLIMPGLDGVVQMRAPCTTCPTPCRTLDFKNWRQCSNTYCQPTILSTFESTEMAIQKQNQYFQETLYTSTCKTKNLWNLLWYCGCGIRSHLQAAKHENFGKEDSKKYKVTFKTVERYLTTVNLRQKSFIIKEQLIIYSNKTCSQQ